MYLKAKLCKFRFKSYFKRLKENFERSLTVKLTFNAQSVNISCIIEASHEISLLVPKLVKITCHWGGIT